MQILTEEELLKEWKCTTQKQKAAFKRLLNKNLPKKTCPRFINPKHIIFIGDERRFYFDPEKGIPEVKFKSGSTSSGYPSSHKSPEPSSTP